MVPSGFLCCQDILSEIRVIEGRLHKTLLSLLVFLLLSLLVEVAQGGNDTNISTEAIVTLTSLDCIKFLRLHVDGTEKSSPGNAQGLSHLGQNLTKLVVVSHERFIFHKRKTFKNY